MKTARSQQADKQAKTLSVRIDHGQHQQLKMAATVLGRPMQDLTAQFIHEGLVRYERDITAARRYGGS